MKQAQQTGRVALVTGAASGIGRQVAYQLAVDEGARVYVADRDAVGAAASAAAIRDAGGFAQEIVIDLADTAALVGSVAGLTAAFGPPDILVNNAGIAAIVPATDLSIDHWHAALEVNVTAPMLLIQHALRHMQGQRWGRIVNIASISGVRAGTGRLAYGTSKAALIAMTRQFAIEVAETGVTVNAIAPGPIDTPMVRSIQGTTHSSSYADMIPMRRFGTPAEIADAVLFLASDHAGYITGHTLAVDGGFLASGVLVRNPVAPSLAPATAA